MKTINRTYSILLFSILLFTTALSSCKKEDAQDTVKTGEIKVSVNATLPPADNYHYYAFNGNITVKLKDNQNIVLATQYIQGSAGNVVFSNISKGDYVLYGEMPCLSINKSNGNTTNRYLSATVNVSFDGAGKSVSMNVN